MKIVFPDTIPFDQSAIDKFNQLGVERYDDLPTDEAVVIERIKDAEIMTFHWMKVTHGMIDAAPKLKYIIAAGAGYNNVDAAYAASKGVKVLNCPTQNSPAVAEMAIGLMFSVSHRILESNTSLRSNHWNGQDMVGTELAGKKLGLVGYGNIGRLIDQKASALGMDVRHTNSKSSDQELDDLLQDSDIVCLCLTLNESTRQIIDERRLKLLQPHAILINIARGGVVDQVALYRALKSGAFRGAGLDVFNDEPTSGQVPAEILELAKLPNVVATPHIGYNTKETVTRLGEELIANIESCLAGKPINVVN